MVQISEAGTSVWHTDASGQQLFGVVFGDRPLALLPEGRYFEVMVDRVRAGQEDGLAIGVTLTPPGQVGQAKELADEVPEFWLAGFDGCFNSSARQEAQLEPLALASCWSPLGLDVGARVGVLVTGEGEMLVFENDALVAKVWDDLPPSDLPLFALVDLLGRVSGVSLLPASRPPVHGLRTLSAFARGLASRCVRVSRDGLAAEHTATPEDAFGVVYGDAPLRLFEPGVAYFEVCVDGLRAPPPGQPPLGDGLVLGVTAARPERRLAAPEFAEDVPQSWSAGYDGFAKSPAREDLQQIPWNPTELVKGDHVGFLVDPAGVAFIYVNGRARARLPDPVTVGVPLYAFVDIAGAVQAVSLVPGAEPPGGHG